MQYRFSNSFKYGIYAQNIPHTFAVNIYFRDSTCIYTIYVLGLFKHTNTTEVVDIKSAAVIGFGCAGFSAARALRQAEPERVIDIYSDTAEAPYNPMLTTYYVSGKIDESTMFPLGDLETIKKELRVNILCGTPVKRLRARERVLELDGGRGRQYDDIIIATGAGAVIPPIKNLPERGIYTMRTASDARRLERALNGVKSAVVVGAQMVGIKVVELLVKRGIRTVLCDMERQMFPASAYERTAAVIAGRLERAGVELRLGAAITGVSDSGKVLSASFSDGSETSADLIVFCSGIRPNIAFVDREEIDVGVGIKTDLHMRASVPHIYAAGDCCETYSPLTGKNAYIGLWANSAMQGRVAGNTIAGVQDEYHGNLIHNITHYMDTDFISVGDVRSEGERVFWQGHGWQLEATGSDGKIAALNILDNAGVSGPVKNALLHRAAHPEQPMSVHARLLLSSAGVPDAIIKKLGGEGA